LPPAGQARSEAERPQKMLFVGSERTSPLHKRVDVWGSLFLECLTLTGNHRPALKLARIAGLPVVVIGLELKPRLNGQRERGLILKADGDLVMLAHGEQLDLLHCPALHAGKFHELPVGQLSFDEGSPV
jgi:hypothetical protein